MTASVLARVPVTVTLVTIITLTSVAAFVWTGLITAFQREPSLIVQGQWWRLLTPILVQKEGVVQFLFNLVGLALLGAAVEERMRRTVMLLGFFAAGVGSAVLLVVLQPYLVDGGTSNAVAGLIGVFVIDAFRSAESRAVPLLPFLYATFFAVYLSAIDLMPIGAAIVAASALTGALASIRIAVSSRAAAPAQFVVVVAAAVVLSAERDGHGFGLAMGMVVGLSAMLATAARVSSRAASARRGSRRP